MFLGSGRLPAGAMLKQVKYIIDDILPDDYINYEYNFCGVQYLNPHCVKYSFMIIYNYITLGDFINKIKYIICPEYNLEQVEKFKLDYKTKSRGSYVSKNETDKIFHLTSENTEYLNELSKKIIPPEYVRDKSYNPSIVHPGKLDERDKLILKGGRFKTEPDISSAGLTDKQITKRLSRKKIR